MSWLANVMAGDSMIKTEILELAAKSKDETIPARERLNAMFELALAVQAGEELQTLVDGLAEEPLEDSEPKYEWRNGAKVRIR